MLIGCKSTAVTLVQWLQRDGKGKAVQADVQVPNYPEGHV